MLNVEGDDIVVVRMERGKVNALDVEMLTAITEVFGELAARPALRAVVLTGDGSIFSAGADLRRVLAGDADYVTSGVQWLAKAFGALFEFPAPLIAAVNGHAIAGGAVITCAADHRVMARGAGVIGLAELRVGVPFPTAALEIVRYAVRPRNLVELIYFGEAYDADAAAERGLIDEVVEPDALMNRALEVAERLGSIPRETFTHTKLALRGPTLEQIERHGPELDPRAAEIWSSPATRGSIERFMQALRA
jgi:enoyl-CoA hydratase